MKKRILQFLLCLFKWFANLKKETNFEVYNTLLSLTSWWETTKFQVLTWRPTHVKNFINTKYYFVKLDLYRDGHYRDDLHRDNHGWNDLSRDDLDLDDLYYNCLGHNDLCCDGLGRKIVLW